MRYVSLANLSEIIRRNFHKIPHDIDLVVGIPRSGMIPASIIALLLNTRLTDIDSFVNYGSIQSNGLTRGNFVRNQKIKKILIVDDSICSGQSMENAKKKLQSLPLGDYNFVFCAPIATTPGSAMVNLAFEIIDDNRIFEWNIFHHSLLQNACIDIDGVLCVDPDEDDDGSIYRNFLQTAKPLFTPTCKVNTLISCRLEKYRHLTEEWLQRNSISYDKLILLNLPSKAARIAWNRHGEYKGEYYKQHPEYVIFIESSSRQAKIIADVSHKPVYCVETNTLITAAEPISQKRRILHLLKKTFPKGYRRIKKTYYKAIGHPL